MQSATFPSGAKILQLHFELLLSMLSWKPGDWMVPLGVLSNSGWSFPHASKTRKIVTEWLLNIFSNLSYPEMSLSKNKIIQTLWKIKRLND